MKSLTVINQQEVLGKDFKFYGDSDNPLFLAKDVASWIEHSNPTEMLKTIDEDEKLNSTILSSGQKRKMSFVNEDGLYEVLMQSRKPIAKKFKKEVKHILRTIRNRGVYLTDEKAYDITHNPNSLADILQQASEQLRQKDLVIEEMKPKALFADAVSTSQTTILVGELAKLLKQNGVDIGATRLFKWLRDNQFLINRRGSDWNMPTQKSMNMKLFQIKETNIQHSDGHVSISKTAKVTGKGQQYFINKFLNMKLNEGGVG